MWVRCFQTREVVMWVSGRWCGWVWVWVGVGVGEEELHNSFPHPHMCKCLQTHKPTNMIHHTHMIHTWPTNNHKHQQTHKLRVWGLCWIWDILLGGLHQDCDDANKQTPKKVSIIVSFSRGCFGETLVLVGWPDISSFEVVTCGDNVLYPGESRQAAVCLKHWWGGVVRFCHSCGFTLFVSVSPKVWPTS